MGKLDNTLVIYINGDNGTSAEGGLLGTPNEVAYFNGVTEMPAETQLKWYDVWGTEETYNQWQPTGPGPLTRLSPGSSRTLQSLAAFARTWPSPAGAD